MKLSLKNFRCHVDKTIEIPSNGLVALSGPSGAGKSTILSAITYAFYGKVPGKVKKLYSHGSKTLQVDLELFLESGSSMQITRSPKPKRLIVILDEVEYEGDAAQSIIEQYLCIGGGMNYEKFIAGAYIVQRSNSSVLSMTPMEQMKFVELLAANDKVEHVKTKTLDAIKQTKKHVLKKQGELESLENQLTEHLDSGEANGDSKIVKMPKEMVKNKNKPEEIRKKLKTLELNLEKLNSQSGEIKQKLDATRENEEVHEKIKLKILSTQAEINVYSKAIKGVNIDEISNQIDEALNEMGDYSDKLHNHKIFYECYKVLLEFNEAVEAHRENAEKIKEEILADESYLDDEGIKNLCQSIQKTKEHIRNYDLQKSLFVNATTEKENAKKKLGLLFKEIKTSYLQRTADAEGRSEVQNIKTPNKMIEFLSSFTIQEITCPSCQTQFCFDERTGTITDHGTHAIAGSKIFSGMEAKNYISQIEENGKKLIIDIQDPGDDVPDIEELTRSLLKARRLKETYSAAASGELSPILIKMEQKIIASMKNLGLEDTPENMAKEAKKYIDGNHEKEILGNLARVKKDLASSENKKEIYEKHLENIKDAEKRKLTLEAKMPKKLVKTSAESLEKQFTTITGQIMTTNNEISEKRTALNTFADYEKYIAFKKSVKKMETRIDLTKKEIERLESKLEGLYGLQEASKEAEIISLEETVRSINEHARVYLDNMFEDPILVRLCCVKENKTGAKTTKLQLNTTIDYRGNTYDDIEELSGGERQRCDMAFLLAVNDMLGCSMILLDECLNNLDSTINTEVLSLIRDTCGGNKLILVVSHEAVKGVFNEEINI